MVARTLARSLAVVGGVVVVAAFSGAPAVGSSNGWRPQNGSQNHIAVSSGSPVLPDPFVTMCRGAEVEPYPRCSGCWEAAYPWAIPIEGVPAPGRLFRLARQLGLGLSDAVITDGSSCASSLFSRSRKSGHRFYGLKVPRGVIK